MDILGFFGRSRTFEAKLELCQPKLYRLAYAWSRNQAIAEDVVQDTLARALAQSRQLKDPDALHNWLLCIMANCLKDHYRRNRKMEDIDDLADDLPACELTPEDCFEQNQLIQRVRQAVGRLPLGQRQVVTLVDLEECSYAEVAIILDVPIGTVMSRLSRARLLLRELLLEYVTHPEIALVPKIARVK